MTLIQSKPNSVVAGTHNTLTMDKAQLISLITNSGDANAAYYADEANWKRVVFYYQDYTKKQKTVVMFDTSTNQGKFKTSPKSKYNKWQLRRIVIEDKDNGLFTLSRSASSATSALNAQEMDVISPNVAPTGIMLAGAVNNSKSIAENTTFVGNLAAVDENINDSHVFSIVSGGDAADFQIVGSNALHFKVAPNFESGKTSYTVTVKATDLEGLFVSQTFTITVVDVAEAPPAESFVVSSTEIKSLSAAYDTVAVLSAIDPEGGNNFVFSLIAGTGDTDNSNFYIVGNKLKSKKSFNGVEKDLYSIRIRVTDIAGTFTDKIFTFSVTTTGPAAYGNVFSYYNSKYIPSLLGTSTSALQRKPTGGRISNDGNCALAGNGIFIKNIITGAWESRWVDSPVNSYYSFCLSADGQFVAQSSNSNSCAIYKKHGNTFFQKSILTLPNSYAAELMTFNPNVNMLLVYASNKSTSPYGNIIVIYKLTNKSIWEQSQTITLSSENNLGVSLEISSDNTIFYGNSTGTTVKTYTYNLTTGQYSAGIDINKPSNLGSNIRFGENISINTVDEIAIGYYQGVSIYNKQQTGGWTETHRFTDTSSSNYGASLSNFKNNMIAITSPSGAGNKISILKKNNNIWSSTSFSVSSTDSAYRWAQYLVLGDNEIINDSPVTHYKYVNNIWTKASNTFFGPNTLTASRFSRAYFVSDSLIDVSDSFNLSKLAYIKENGDILFNVALSTDSGKTGIPGITSDDFGTHYQPSVSLDKKYLSFSYNENNANLKKFKLFKNTEENPENFPFYTTELSLDLNTIGINDYSVYSDINDAGNVFVIASPQTSTASSYGVVKVYEKINNVWTNTWTLNNTGGSSSNRFIYPKINKTGNIIAFQYFNSSSSAYTLGKVYKKSNLNEWIEVTNLPNSTVLGSNVDIIGFDKDDMLMLLTPGGTIGAGVHSYSINASNQLVFSNSIFHSVTGYRFMSFTSRFDAATRLNSFRDRLFLQEVKTDTTRFVHTEVYTKQNNNWKKIAKMPTSNTDSAYGPVVLSCDSSGSKFMAANTATGEDFSVIKLSSQYEKEYLELEKVIVSNIQNGHTSVSADGLTMVRAKDTGASVTTIEFYAKNETDWALQQTYTGNSDPYISSTISEISLSGDGNTLAIGYSSKRIGSSTLMGQVDIFKRTGNSWAKIQSLDTQSSLPAGYTSSGSYRFGASVSLDSSGTTLAVGATHYGYGAAFIFKLNNNVWTHYYTNTNALSTNQGYTYGKRVRLSPSGNTLCLTHPSYNNAFSNQGYILVFDVPSKSSIINFYQPSGSTGTYSFSQDGELFVGSDNAFLIQNKIFTRSGSTWSTVDLTLASNEFNVSNFSRTSSTATYVGCYLSPNSDFAVGAGALIYKKINNGTWVRTDTLDPRDYELDTSEANFYTIIVSLSGSSDYVFMTVGQNTVIFNKS